VQGMAKYNALAVATGYWKPSVDFEAKICDALEGKVLDGDFVVVSEKAISTALGSMVDESKVNPSLNAQIIAKIWMKIGWGYFLGPICHFGKRLNMRLRDYPQQTGSRHKQVALQYAGLSQALMFGSEGGIDGSNLPYSYVSLPLNNPVEIAKRIRRKIQTTLNRHVCVVIVDTDKTYQFRNFYFTPRPNPLGGIHSFGGTATYVFGRFLKFKRSSTPLATAGCILPAKEALKIANIADRTRGPGSGATVWDMAARFQAPVNGVSYDMLAKIKHKPIVIVRKIQN
jgi:F420-0:gamma-glutamyl ligase-like protein